MKNPIKYFNYFLIFMCISTILSYSQEKEKTVKLDGDIGLFYDGYNYYTENYPNFRPRNLEEIFRLNMNLNFSIGKHFSVPFGVNVSSQRTSYNLPNVPEENLFSYVQNPINNIHIDPKYKWFQAHLGSHTPNYSELTTGDIQIFGAGFEINPGKFIMAANYGKSQIAFEPDVLLNIPGAYAQKIYGARIGFGKIEGSKFVLNFIKIDDEIDSVVNKPIGIDPISGITFSPQIEVKFTDKLTLKTETAGSIYTSNLLANTIIFNEDYLNTINKYITLNASSRADFSNLSSLEWKSKKFMLGGEIKFIGPGFIPVGYRNIEKDIIDYKINTGFKIFKEKLDIKGSFGIRTNNIKNTKLQSTQRVISNMNVFAQITPAFSINANYNNFSFGNNETNNLIRIEMINNSFSLAPSYQIDTESKMHQISANVAINSFEQFDVTANDFTTTNSKSYNANYMMMFKKSPLTIGFSGLYLNNKSPISDLNLINFSTNIGYKFYKKKIIPSLNIGYAIINKDNFTADKRINLKLKTLYKINKKLDFNFAYAFNNNQYGSYRPDGLLNENIFQISMLKKF